MYFVLYEFLKDLEFIDALHDHDDLHDRIRPCSDDCHGWAICSWISWAAAWVLALPVLFYNELKSMNSQGFVKYFEDVQNYYDLGQSGLFFFTLVLPITRLDTYVVDVLRAFSVLCSWVCLLFKLMVGTSS